MSARGDAFALRLARNGVPVSDHTRDVCARMARCAVTIQRLAEEECNGVDDWRAVGSVEEWQAGLARRMARAESRFVRLVSELRESVALCSPNGANTCIGGFDVWGDPRGNTTAVDVHRNGAGDPVSVGVIE